MLIQSSIVNRQSSICLIFVLHLAYLFPVDPTGICAVILAGGQSRRMGFNKAFLNVGGQPLIQVLASRIRPLADQILISSNDGASYKFLDIPVIPDHFSGHGPLAGFHSAMLWDVRPLYLVLACDLPNLGEPLLRNLIRLVDGFDAAIPKTRDGLAHPLCAIYRRTCLPYVERALQRGANKVIENFLDSTLTIRWVTPDEGQFEDADLANINTPEDLSKLKIHPGSPTPPNSIYSS
jgi:molybdopterin-guanine dinucleotide biosynthesis protein A